MPFVAECPSCGQKLKVPDNLAGKKVRCSKCANSFLAETITADAPPPPPPAPARSSDDDHDRDSDRNDDYDRPSRRGNGGAPGRGGMLMTFGIISVVMAVLAVMITVVGFIIPFVGFCSWLFVIIGIVMGLMAWLMSSGDLKRIKAGAISQSAMGGTKTGFVTGIIGTIVNALLLLCSCLMIILAIAGFAAFAAQSRTSSRVRSSIETPPAKVAPHVPSRLSIS